MGKREPDLLRAGTDTPPAGRQTLAGFSASARKGGVQNGSVFLLSLAKCRPAVNRRKRGQQRVFEGQIS